MSTSLTSRFPVPVFLLLVVAQWLSGSASASQNRAAKELAVTLDARHRQAVITVPKQVASVAVEFRKPRSAGWTLYKTIKVRTAPATIHLALPEGSTANSWRATGVTGNAQAPKKVFPNSFYRGKTAFTKVLAPSYAVETNVPSGSTLNSGSSASDLVAAASTGTASSLNSSPGAPATTTGTPVQADIWETSGTTAYFFNQLRGLQVIDLSNPANPVLNATYRLPAVGQDLYVVQGPGSTNYAILLTQQYDQNSSQYGTGILLIAVSGGTTQLVSSNSLPGWLADSRMVGNQLYLSTQQWSWDGSGNGPSITLNQMTVDPVGGAIYAGGSLVSQGYYPILSAGDDWIALSQYSRGNWQNSTVTLYALGTNGATLLTTNPITLTGCVSDEYDVQYAGGILSAVTQRWVQDTNNGTNDWWSYNPVTSLQNFTPDGTLQGSVTIDASNGYSAARFSGTSLYVVTSGWNGSGQNNPLHVLDNSSPTNPVVAGEANLPGTTTQLEPLGTQLFTLGYDSNWRLNASLYDVSSLTNPNLLSSVSLSSNASTSWGYSPATWDPEAFNVMTNAGLVTIPYTCSDSNGNSASSIQLLALNTTNGTLGLAGSVPTGANPLRSAMVGGALACITQQELVTADVSNPNSPNVLADLTLAWSVDKIAVSGNYLIEITAGTSWDGEVPSATIATVADPDNALSQTNLGTGVIVDAQLQGNALYVLRQNPANSPWWWDFPVLHDALNGGGAPQGQVPTLYLDTYDVSRLPALTLLGSSSNTLPGTSTSWEVGGLLFPSTNCAVAVAQPQSLNYWGFYGGIGPVIIDPIVTVQPVAVSLAKTPSLKKAVSPALGRGSVSPALIPVDSCVPFRRFGGAGGTPATAIIWQVNDPTAPVAQAPVALTDTNATPVKYSAASNNLLVFGYGEREGWLQGAASGMSSCTNYLGLLDLSDPTAPVLGAGIALPGRLEAVTSLTYNGFLAWTESWTGTDSSPGARQVQVSACDTVNVYQITSLNLSQQGPLAAYGNNLFTAQGTNLNGYSLDNSGTLNSSGTISLAWIPSGLLPFPVQNDSNSCTLLGSDGWNNLFGTVWNNSGPESLLNDPTPLGTTLTNDLPMGDGSVLSPAGSYGVDRFQP